MRKVIDPVDPNIVLNCDDLINHVASLAPMPGSKDMEYFKMMALNVVLDIILFANSESYDKRTGKAAVRKKKEGG